VEVAVKSGLEVDNDNGGIVVNQQLEAVSNVFVAGGVASYFDSALGRRRVEMFDHSINSGEGRRWRGGGWAVEDYGLEQALCVL
jgi:programmed cell death 8 (apoptosis-inducing factor)